MFFIIKLYILQLIILSAYMFTSKYINNKKSFESYSRFKQWLIPFYLPFIKIKKGLTTMFAQMKINNE